MTLTPAQMAFLQRLVAEHPVARNAGDTAKYFCEHYAIGVQVGNRVEYQSRHFDTARGVLDTHDLPHKALARGTSRAQAALYGGMSEKAQSSAPHSNSVAIKALGTCTLDGHLLYSPTGGYTVLTAADARRVTCERLMPVENLETFRRLESYAWLDRRGFNLLAIYRGDTTLPNRDAAEVIDSRTEPVWGFFDFDPAGLLMANSLPPHRLERLVLPSSDWLEHAADTARGRQLFDSQLAQCERVLDHAKHPGISDAWRLMRRLRSAVTQERMLHAEPSTGST
jgi:hypothetical protein